jgi:hypothetical protein
LLLLLHPNPNRNPPTHTAWPGRRAWTSTATTSSRSRTPTASGGGCPSASRGPRCLPPPRRWAEGGGGGRAKAAAAAPPPFLHPPHRPPAWPPPRTPHTPHPTPRTPHPSPLTPTPPTPHTHPITHPRAQERKKLLSFVVVGGGPTGVEVAAELYDMIHEDLRKLYGPLVDDVSRGREWGVEACRLCRPDAAPAAGLPREAAGTSRGRAAERLLLGRRLASPLRRRRLTCPLPPPPPPPGAHQGGGADGPRAVHLRPRHQQVHGQGVWPGRCAGGGRRLRQRQRRPTARCHTARMPCQQSPAPYNPKPALAVHPTHSRPRSDPAPPAPAPHRQQASTWC